MAGIEDILGQVLGGASGGKSAGGGGLDLAKLAGPLMAMLGGKAGSGGLGSVLGKLQANGLSSQVDSWVGTGENEPVDPAAIEAAIGPDAIEKLAQESGLSPEEVSTGLSEALPQVVDQMSPDGELPES